MNNENGKMPLITELIRYFGVIFTMSILAISLMGLLIAYFVPDTQDLSFLFNSGGMGLSYRAILQIAGFSLIQAVFFILLISERLVFKIRFWLRILLLFFSALFTFSIFAIFFNWFPVNDLQAWLSFVLSALICFILSSCLTLLRFKLEGKKYDRLLANYKARHNKSS
jgi:hypothetical protein